MDDFAEEETDFDVIREKTVFLKPESVEEAILQMNLLGHKFYMFLNSETDTINVVYKRNETGYGLIIPENNWISKWINKIKNRLETVGFFLTS